MLSQVTNCLQLPNKLNYNFAIRQLKSSENDLPYVQYQQETGLETIV